MNLYAMALLLYGSGFVGDCDTIGLSIRLLAWEPFGVAGRQEQIQTSSRQFMVTHSSWCSSS
jgi:hypothetical protein